MRQILSQLVREGDIDGTIGVFHHFGHFGGANVGHRNLALAEAGIQLRHGFAHLGIVGTDRAIVAKKLAHHVARYDAFGGVHKPDVFSAVLGKNGSDVAIDRTGRNSGLDDENSPFRRMFENRFGGGHNIARVDLLIHLVVRRGNAHDVGVAHLILGREYDARFQCLFEKFVKPLFLECGASRIKRRNQFFVVVRSDDLHTMRCHHQGGRQADVAQSDNVHHFEHTPLLQPRRAARIHPANQKWIQTISCPQLALTDEAPSIWTPGTSRCRTAPPKQALLFSYNRDDWGLLPRP